MESECPQKVKIFGWRVARDSMPTKRNKMRRTLEVDSICKICGNAEENSHDAVIACTKARALRHEMLKHWNLPPENLFVYSGPDWLQNLLMHLSKETCSQVLMLLWRAWHLRNDVIHQMGDETIARSVAFLLNYDNSLNSTLSLEDRKSVV